MEPTAKTTGLSGSSDPLGPAAPAGGETMQVQTNQISRDWTILHEGRTFYVNYTQSDGQTLAICNRDNWEIWEETPEGTEELDIYSFSGDNEQERAKARENFKLMKRLIGFCIEQWDSGFLREIEADLQEQKKALETF